MKVPTLVTVIYHCQHLFIIIIIILRTLIIEIHLKITILKCIYIYLIYLIGVRENIILETR